VYRLGATGERTIDLVVGDNVITEQFIDDRYFRLFLMMLSGVLAYSQQQKGA
jgi:hypothetical protein